MQEMYKDDFSCFKTGSKEILNDRQAKITDKITGSYKTYPSVGEG